MRGIGFLESAGYAADEAAAADGHDDSFDVRDLFEQFEGDGALAGDDFGIVEGMDEGAAFFEAAAHGLVAGLVVAGAVEDHFRAVAARGGDLNQRRGKRHDDLGADAARRGVKRDALRVIAGAGCDHSAFAFGLRKGEELVERTALLERASALQVFQLQVQRQAHEFRKMVREMARGNMDCLADTRSRDLNAGETYGVQGRCLRQNCRYQKAKATNRAVGEVA